MTDDTIKSESFVVVVNDEEQYSLWSAESPLPSGWRAAGFEGDKDECLKFIEREWTDMRPKSLRSLLDRQG